jgi:hypothetical protein
MSSSLRNDNNKFYNVTGVTASEQSNAVEISGSRGFSVLVTLADNGSGAGNISLRGSLDGTNWVEISGSEQTITFSASAQKMLFNIVDAMYKYVDVDVTISAGDIDVDAEITIIEGGA